MPKWQRIFEADDSDARRAHDRCVTGVAGLSIQAANGSTKEDRDMALRQPGGRGLSRSLRLLSLGCILNRRIAHRLLFPCRSDRLVFVLKALKHLRRGAL